MYRSKMSGCIVSIKNVCAKSHCELQRRCFGMLGLEKSTATKKKKLKNK